MSARSRRLWGTVCLLLICLSLRGEPLAAGGKAETPRDKKPRTDLYGDPLPPGALARMGTARFRHALGVRFLTFSPDGKTVASVGRPSSVGYLWEAASGKELRRFELDEFGDNPPAFSPNGKLLALASGHAIRLYEVSSGKEVQRLGNGLQNIRELTFSPDGKVLAVADCKRNLTLWEVAAGKQILQLKEKLGDPGSDGGMVFSPDGKTLALLSTPSPRRAGSSGAERIVGVWDVKTGKFLRQFGNRVVAAQPKDDWGGPRVALTSDGKLLAAITQRDGSMIHVWEVATGKEVHYWKAEHSFNSITFSPDDKILAGGDSQGKIHLLDRLGKESRSFQAHDSRVTCLAFAPDGKRLASGGRYDPKIHLWDPLTGKNLLAPVGHQGVIRCLTLTPDGKQLATGGSDNTVRLWDAATGKEFLKLAGGGNSVNSLACSPDGRTLAVGSQPGVIQLVDLKTRAQHRLTLDGRDCSVGALDFSPDGKLLASGDSEGHLRLWDPKARKQLRQMVVPQRDIFCVAFSPSGKLLASGSSDGVAFWEVAAGKEKPAWSNHAALGSGPVWSPDGRTLAWSDGGGSIRLEEVATGKTRCRLQGHSSSVFAIAFAPDGRHLVSGGGGVDCTVRVWPLAGGNGQGLRGHQESVLGVVFFPDGQRVASASADTTALVWEVAQGKKPEKEPSLSPAELQARWDELAGADAMKAYQAMWALVNAPRQSIPFLKKYLKQVPHADVKKLDQLIKDLNSDSFATRDRATRELATLSDLAREPLEAVLRKKPPLEVRKRVELLLGKLGKNPLRGALRAVEALEYMANAEAKKLLDELARGIPGTPLTEEAKESLTRLNRKAPAS
jgi:WD40 repeat protein